VPPSGPHLSKRSFVLEQARAVLLILEEWDSTETCDI
jgi:hypothetical protein